jgi:hypothetical protein
MLGGTFRPNDLLINFWSGPEAVIQDFISKVMEIALANRVNVIIPLVTSELAHVFKVETLYFFQKK